MILLIGVLWSLYRYWLLDNGIGNLFTCDWINWNAICGLDVPASPSCFTQRSLRIMLTTPHIRYQRGLLHRYVYHIFGFFVPTNITFGLPSVTTILVN